MIGFTCWKTLSPLCVDNLGGDLIVIRFRQQAHTKYEYCADGQVRFQASAQINYYALLILNSKTNHTTLIEDFSLPSTYDAHNVLYVVEGILGLQGVTGDL